ncbi:MAG: phosphate starvation-inducible protein PhoH [Bacteroidetes bacterium]|nr:MAG: phosphate starvation-inducible protein PhoH [Bacteroidota bacterium]
MAERIIEITSIDPVTIYGVNDVKLELIRKYFPKLKIVARGDVLKAVGDEPELDRFEQAVDAFVKHFNRYGSFTESNIEHMMGKGNGNGNGGSKENPESAPDVIVFGNSGLIVKARTPGQQRLVDSVGKNDMVFAIGPAGTGKTYTAVALAVRALRNKEVRKIILTRPAVEAGENLGFLPGDLKEKLDPYLQPLYDALFDMIPAEKLKTYIESNIIQIAPLAFMRGRTLDNAFVILDEAQNATEAQMKMFLTRMGPSAKFVVTGDVTQIDLPNKQPSGLLQAVKLLPGAEGLDFVYLDNRDVIRHKLVKRIIELYDDKK